MIGRLLDKILFYWQEKRRYFLLIMAVVILAFISILMNLRVGSGSADILEDDLLLLTGKQEELRNILLQRRQLEIPMAAIAGLSEQVWLNSRDGEPDYEFRRRIETAAQQAGITLKSIGPLQHGRPAYGVSSYEITVLANMQYAELFKFMDGLRREKSSPVFWKSLTVTPDNLRNPKFLLVNGTLKIVNVYQRDILKLWETSP